MPVFTLIATGWRHQNMRTGKNCFTKKHCFYRPFLWSKAKLGCLFAMTPTKIGRGHS